MLKQFLGSEIDHSDVGIKVIQSKYATEILLNFNMVECKESKCPFLSGVKLGGFGSSPLVDSLLYILLVGSLLYLAHSRTKLDYAVGVVARHM